MKKVSGKGLKTKLVKAMQTGGGVEENQRIVTGQSKFKAKDSGTDSFGNIAKDVGMLALDTTGAGLVSQALTGKSASEALGYKSKSSSIGGVLDKEQEISKMTGSVIKPLAPIAAGAVATAYGGPAAGQAAFSGVTAAQGVAEGLEEKDANKVVNGVGQGAQAGIGQIDPKTGLPLTKTGLTDASVNPNAVMVAKKGGTVGSWITGKAKGGPVKGHMLEGKNRITKIEDGAFVFPAETTETGKGLLKMMGGKVENGTMPKGNKNVDVMINDGNGPELVVDKKTHNAMKKVIPGFDKKMAPNSDDAEMFPDLEWKESGTKVSVDDRGAQTTQDVIPMKKKSGQGLMKVMAKGGNVKGYADGGGVDDYDTLPESVKRAIAAKKAVADEEDSFANYGQAKPSTAIPSVNATYGDVFGKNKMKPLERKGIDLKKAEDNRVVNSVPSIGGGESIKNTGATRGAGIKNILSKIDAGDVASGIQAGLGAQQLAQDELPMYQETPATLKAISDAHKRAGYGMEAGVIGQAKREIASNMSNEFGAAKELAGNDVRAAYAIKSNAINNANKATQDLYNADQAAKNEKQNFAYGADMTAESRNRMKYDDKFGIFTKRQEAGSQLLGAGLESYLTNQRIKKQRELDKEIASKRI